MKGVKQRVLLKEFVDVFFIQFKLGQGRKRYCNHIYFSSGKDCNLMISYMFMEIVIHV